MKPTLPKGVRDFLPEQVNKRNYIFRTIETVFRSYGFGPIETPTMESLSTLSGKYGEEGDKLLFKIVNNGDFLSKVSDQVYESKDSNQLISHISKRGLRYDLTVPFARFVVMHQNEISFPFKRYQIQPVWRADRPQKGRYQEFYQCDADVIGSNSLMYEAELMQIFDQVYHKLRIPEVTILINNRKVLYGIAESAGIADQFMDMTIAIDKLDKIGLERVCELMAQKGIPESSIESIKEMIQAKELSDLEEAFAKSETGRKGLEELREFHKFFDSYKIKNTIKFDVTLARGLNYYTGCIFEVKTDAVSIGSIGGGGRYDDLTGVFGLKNVSGVGISFGADRIYDVMEELELFPESLGQGTTLLFVSFDDPSHQRAFEYATELREEGINTDVYPGPVKFAKQMKYANSIEVPYVAILGSEELASNKIKLKDMASGSETMLDYQELVRLLQTK